MMANNSRGTVLLAFVVLLLTVGGCGSGARVGALQTESNSVALGNATSVRVEIDLGAGELSVAGGAAGLLDATFTYNVAELKPEIDYGGGALAVRTPNVSTGFGSFLDLANFRNEWTLRLNDAVPMEMQVNVGAGGMDLKLGSLSLTKLDVGGGAGNVTVDLTGAWHNDLQATIQGGVGNRILILPRDTGVRVKVEVGLGSVDAAGLTKQGDYYVNGAYGQSSVTLEIQVEGGVGGTELRLGG